MIERQPLAEILAFPALWQRRAPSRRPAWEEIHPQDPDDLMSLIAIEIWQRTKAPEWSTRIAEAELACVQAADFWPAHLRLEALTNQFANAKLIHGKTPMYGYDWDGEGKARYVPNTVTSAVVKRIFAEIIAGGTLRAVGMNLTGDGIPTPRGARVWDVTTVRHIARGRNGYRSPKAPSRR